MSFFSRLHTLLSSLSRTGKIIFYGLVVIFIISTISILWRINEHFMVEVPRQGGSFTEGVLGLPRFVNPILAVTDADKDLVALSYSGLMRHTPEGIFVPDLAESYTVDPQGKIYTFTLRKNATFHDGTPVTSADVTFTVEKVLDPKVQSPKRAHWDGVRVETPDEFTVIFRLNEAYAPFLENTTLGILPKHLWSKASPETFSLGELNSKPVGSGPFKVSAINRDRDGIPTSYELERFDDFILGKPYIRHITIKFFPNETEIVNARNSGAINSVAGITPAQAVNIESRAPLARYPLPRAFAVFFNPSSNPVLTTEVRRALDISVDKAHIVNTVLQGFGTPLQGPVPESLLTSQSKATSTVPADVTLDTAIGVLERDGWKTGSEGILEKKIGQNTVELAFSISTSDVPELTEVAEILKARWERLGVRVTIKTNEGGYLNQDVIRPRKYDALLFGQVINRELDVYAFWHSSERADPGLNIATYSNSAVDKILEEMRTTQDRSERILLYEKLAVEINNDAAAVFLYAPDFIYAIPSQVRGLTPGVIVAAHERFSDIYTWYINTDRMWEVFARYYNN